MSKLKGGRVHFGNSGMKELVRIIYNVINVQSVLQPDKTKAKKCQITCTALR